MTFDLEDLRRAARGGGDISAFSPVYARALDCPPALVAADLSRPVALAPFLADQAIEGGPAADGSSLEIAAFGPAQTGTCAFLRNLLHESHYAALVVDLTPTELGAWMAYSHSLLCALGLSVNGRVQTAAGRARLALDLHPGGLLETLVLHCRLHRIPLLAAAQPAIRRGLIPVPNQGFIDPDEIESSAAPLWADFAAGEYDSQVGNAPDLQQAMELARKAAAAGLARVGSAERARLIDGSRYLASRIYDLERGGRSHLSQRKILALVKIEHLLDCEYVLSLLRRGIASETYLSPEPDPEQGGLTFRAGLIEETGSAEMPSPEEGPGQQLFAESFRDYVNNTEGKGLSRDEASEMVADITRRTRVHPEIKRGASVRGGLAFRELVDSLALIENALTPRVVERAAQIALPPRILPIKAESSRALVADIAKEVIYHISFKGGSVGVAAGTELRSPGREFLKSLRALEEYQSEGGSAAPAEDAPAVVDSEPSLDMLNALEKKNLLRRDEKGQYSLTRKALQLLMDELEERYQSGDIDQQEYRRQKARLASKMRGLSEPEFSLSSGEIANTVMEMIDAQDRQWNSEINFNALHVYYHIKDSVEGAALSPQKRDYFALKRLIDDMEKRQIIAPLQNSGGFALTGLALEILLRQLIRPRRQHSGSRLIGQSSLLATERRQEIRRYSSCDPFRAISFRHTLREVARQKKGLGELKRRDLRVFLKLRQKPRLDILLCLDISGSMGFQQKLIYARLAAAGIVEAALKEGHRVGIVAFNDHGQVSVPLGDSNRSGLLNCLASLSARGNTNIGDGLRASREILGRSGERAQQYIILISDGQPSAVSQEVFAHLKGEGSRDLTQESAYFEARQAAARGVQLSVVHVAGRNEPSDAFMKELARIGRGSLARVARPQDLNALLAG